MQLFWITQLLCACIAPQRKETHALSARGRASPLTMLQLSERLQIAYDTIYFNWLNHLFLPVDETEGGCLLDIIIKAIRCHGIEVLLLCSMGAKARRTLPAGQDDSPGEVHRFHKLFVTRTKLQQRQRGQQRPHQDVAVNVLEAHPGQRRAPLWRQLRASLGQQRASLVSQQSASRSPFDCGRGPFCMGGCTV